MKNEKFCFSKGTGLIALVGIFLVGFIIANQALTNTQTSTNSRASKNSEKRLIPTLAPIPPVGTLILSELNNLASTAIAQLTAAMGLSATLDTADLAKQKTAIETAQTNATRALTAVTTQIETSLEVIDGIITQLTANKKTADKAVETAEDTKTVKDQALTEAQGALEKAQGDAEAMKGVLDTAKEATRLAQEDANSVATSEDVYKKQLGSAQSDVTTKLAALSTSKTAFVNALKTLPGVRFIPGWDINRPKKWIDMINTVTVGDEIGYMKALNKISTESYSIGIGKHVLSIHPFITVLKTSQPVKTAYTKFVMNINSTAGSKARLAVIQKKGDKFQSLADAKAAQETAQDNYDAAVALVSPTGTLARAITTAQTAADDAGRAVALAQNKVTIYESMLTEATNAKNRITDTNSLVSETKTLPAGIVGVEVPYTLYSIDALPLQLVQVEIDKVNVSITKANTAYTAFDTAISGTATEITTQVGAYTQFCNNVKSSDPTQKFYPIISNGLPTWWAQEYYEEHCAANETDYGWNGWYGDKAKCYVATGLCTASPPSEPCITTRCIVNIDIGKACINQEVKDTATAKPFTACITQYEAKHPGLDILNKRFSCTPMDSYFVFNGKYYREKSMEVTGANGQKLCKNELLETPTKIQAAKDWITKHLHDSYASVVQKCIDNGNIGWVGISNYEIRIPETYLAGYPAPTPMSKGYDTCVLLMPGATSGKDSAPCLQINNAFCQCVIDLGYRKDDATGKYMKNGKECPAVASGISLDMTTYTP